VVCCTYATAPLIEVADLINGYKQLFIEPTPDYVCAVAKYGYPIQRALRKVNGILEMAEMENLEKFSQELDERYHDAGQFYFAKAQTWIEMKPMLVNTRGIELPSWKVQDIDNLEDWERAEILFDIMKIKSQT
jgi:N-acylneuraminate cytidylyltransferase